MTSRRRHVTRWDAVRRGTWVEIATFFDFPSTSSSLLPDHFLGLSY